GPAEERFTLFLIQYWGGPTTYSNETAGAWDAGRVGRWAPRVCPASAGAWGLVAQFPAPLGQGCAPDPGALDTSGNRGEESKRLEMRS
ncbi:hypothetical protein ABZ504_35465, partial [Streptomyces mirabilis]